MRSSNALRFWNIILCFILIYSSLCAMANAYAQEKTASVGADEIKAMLLRPEGWLVEWRGASDGVSDYVFEARDEKIVVKIQTVAWNMSCERDVTITSEAIKFDACYDTGISLHFDLNDQKYPFKGESTKVNYKLKAK